MAFIVLAFVSLIIAAGAHTAPYAFHALLFCAGSLAAVFAIANRYYERSPQLPSLEISGRPNYNFGPVKFATLAAIFWGIAGFAVGLWAALELAFPVLNFDLPWLSFGRIRPLHTSAVIFAFGGNVLIATSFYVVQRTSHARLVGDIAHLVRRARLQLLHRHRRHRISARHHPVEGICRTRVVCRPLAHGCLGRLPIGVPRRDHAAQGAAHLCGELVLPRLHPDERGAASRQQRVDPGVEFSDSQLRWSPYRC
jgi:hypothetical protein